MVLASLSLVSTCRAQASVATDSVEEIGESPTYYRLPELGPTLMIRGGPSFGVDFVRGATAWGFRLGVGLAFAVARDPHHVLVLDGGYAYRGFDDHLGALGVSYLFTDADSAADINTQPGVAVSVAALGGGRVGAGGAGGAGVRVAIAFRYFFYMLEFAYEGLATEDANMPGHLLVLTFAGSGLAW